MEIVCGKRRFDMESVLGYQDVQHAVKTVKKNGQWLAVYPVGHDPDDAFSSISYEKGALLLTEIENEIGREAFDKFLNDH